MMYYKKPDWGDPDDVFIGVCLTCQTPIECKRPQVRMDKNDAWGTTSDNIPVAECPKCKARIYLKQVFPAKEKKEETTL